MNKNDQARYENQGDQLALTYSTEDEETRVYTFPGGDAVEIKGASEVRVSRHGHHLISTRRGIRHVVPRGWICMTIDGPAATPEQYAVDRAAVG